MARKEMGDAKAAYERGDYKFAAHEVADAAKYEATAMKDKVGPRSTASTP
jgi:hypothetical protein